MTQMDCKPICDGGAGTVSGSRYIAPDELSIQDSLPGARVQRAQLFARVKGGSLAQWM